MAKANKYFTKRGVQDIIIDFEDEKLNIKITKPTNKEHDDLMEQFTTITPDGQGDIQMANFVEGQMVQFVIDLPFEVPVDNDLNIYKNWNHTNIDERKIAVSLMDPHLRDMITNAINGITNINNKELGN